MILLAPSGPLENLATQIATQYGIDPGLIRAICEVESSWNQWANRYEPNYNYPFFIRENAARLNISVETETQNQKTSWGLTQVMGGKARELGFTGSIPQLCQPDIAIDLSCKLIKALLVRYGSEHEDKIVAAYNAGSAEYTPGGMFKNQAYVNKIYLVLRRLRQLQ